MVHPKPWQKGILCRGALAAAPEALKGPGGDVDAGCTGSWCGKMLFTYWIRRAIAISCVRSAKLPTDLYLSGKSVKSFHEPNVLLSPFDGNALGLDLEPKVECGSRLIGSTSPVRIRICVAMRITAKRTLPKKSISALHLQCARCSFPNRYDTVGRLQV